MARTYRERIETGTDTTNREMLLSDAKAYGRFCKRLGQYPECAEMADPVFKAAALAAYGVAVEVAA